MKIAILDITSRNAAQYNPALCKALSDINKEGEVTLVAPKLHGVANGFKFMKLLTIVPNKWAGGEDRIKRVVRAIEVVLNYFFIFFYLVFKRPDVLHIQWLPFVEFMGGEKYYLMLLKKFVPKLKIFYTAHNIYPHRLSGDRKNAYIHRFVSLDRYIDGYLVHLFSAKEELSGEFNIPQSKIFVAFHGIYIAENYTPSEHSVSDGVKRVIMYGFQNKYKGADILIDAIGLLSEEYKKKISVKIVGLATDKDLYSTCQEKAKALNVEWINDFVSDETLYDAIGRSDLILLPYRKISQSGVLLLALSFRKPILTSDLPSFKETLEGYPDEYFFKSEDPKSLSKLLENFVDGKIDVELQMGIIEKLNIKYSWAETAKSTLNAYNNVFKDGEAAASLNYNANI